jgi:hypothetical protein
MITGLCAGFGRGMMRRIDPGEENLPAKQKEAQQEAWLPKSHVDPSGP